MTIFQFHLLTTDVLLWIWMWLQLATVQRDAQLSVYYRRYVMEPPSVDHIQTLVPIVNSLPMSS